MAGNEATLMSAAFFDFIGHIATAAQDDSEEQERIIVIGNRIAALHEAYAKAAENEAQLAEANNKLQDLLQVPALSDAKAKGAPLATQNETKDGEPMVQVDTLEEADQKIDKMAAEGQIDPAFLLTMAKAYSGVKETDLAQEEVRPVTTTPRPLLHRPPLPPPPPPPFCIQHMHVMHT